MRHRALAAVATLLALTGCAPVAKQAAAVPPPGFPNLNDFADVDPADYDLGGPSFVSPQQISCALDVGSFESIVCSGNIRGIPESVSGDGCAAVRKVMAAKADVAYTFERSATRCAPSKYVPLTPGRKLSADNGTCAVGDNGLVACIDADTKHGFVLNPEGSWAF